MSLIPLDDQRGDEQPTPAADRTPQSGVGRLWDRLQSFLTRLTGRLNTRGETETADSSVKPLPSEDETAPSRQQETVGLPRQNVELVSSESDGTLTVTDADNPEATITSDTWETVDR